MLYVWHPSGHPCSPCAAPRTQHRAFFSECLFQGYKGRCAARGSVCGLRPAVTARLVFHCCKKLLKIKKKEEEAVGPGAQPHGPGWALSCSCSPLRDSRWDLSQRTAPLQGAEQEAAAGWGRGCWSSAGLCWTPAGTA